MEASQNDKSKQQRGKGKGGRGAKAPAPCETSTGDIAKLIEIASSLSLNDRILAAKAIAGMSGMVALFPSQIPAKQRNQPGKNPPGGNSDKSKKEKGPKDPPNPLKQSDTYKIFQKAQKALQEAKKANKGEDLPEDHPLVVAFQKALEDWKTFRSEHQNEAAEGQDQVNLDFSNWE